MEMVDISAHRSLAVLLTNVVNVLNFVQKLLELWNDQILGKCFSDENYVLFDASAKNTEYLNQYTRTGLV